MERHVYTGATIMANCCARITVAISELLSSNLPPLSMLHYFTISFDADITG
jgi:hypothetical protein